MIFGLYSDPNIGRICIFGLYSDPNTIFGSEYRPNMAQEFWIRI